MATQGSPIAASLIAIDPSPATTVEAGPPPPPAWRRIALRFAVAYWVLWLSWCFEVDVLILEKVRPHTIDVPFNAVVTWLGKTVFGLTGLSFQLDGSGDRTVDWIAWFCVACSAVIATIVWTAIAHVRAGQRPPSAAAQDDQLRRWLRVCLRYALGIALLGYGFAKVFPIQFPQPNDTLLAIPYRDASPMGLVWRFMGYSPAYALFGGVAEVAGAILVLFRRTATLGAIVLAAVLTNVVVLNLCYDVPLKINAAHYLAMCVYLIGSDLRRLANLLWFYRPTQPTPARPPITRRWMRIARRIIKYGSIGLVMAPWLYLGVASLRASTRPRWWADGRWQVGRFVRDGHELPADVPDPTRWRVIRFQDGEDKRYVRWRFIGDSYGDLFDVTVDDAQHVFHLSPSTDAPHAHSVAAVDLRFARSDASHMTLDGKVDGATLHVELELPDRVPSLLMERGFHWVNDEPFNR